MFSTWSTADHYRRRLLLAPPSPTAHSAVFQPVAVATSTGTAAAAFALGGGSDSEVTRVSLWGAVFISKVTVNCSYFTWSVTTSTTK